MIGNNNIRRKPAIIYFLWHIYDTDCNLQNKVDKFIYLYKVCNFKIGYK